MTAIKINFSSIIIFVLSLFPCIYFTAAIIDNKSLYAIKDLLLLMLFVVLLFQRFSIGTYVCLSIFLIINVYALLFSYEDTIFYILSVREFLFYPMVGILLGGYLGKQEAFEPGFYKLILVTLFLTLLYLLIFPNDSFGSTFRLRSFWDREHEPAIIAGVAFIWTLYSRIPKSYKYFLIFLSILIMFLSASRSILLSVFLVTVLLSLRNLNLVKISVLFVIAAFVIANFSSLSPSGRTIDHNLDARTSQYTLAMDNLEENDFLGLGTDKYGVVGSIKKEFCYQGHCTTTMDSSLLKYTLNYGIVFLLSLFLFLFVLGIYYLNIRTALHKKILGTIVFGLLLGAVTGKLGAFPLNLIFYMSIGVMMYHFSLIQPKREKSENNTVCS